MSVCTFFSTFVLYSVVPLSQNTRSCIAFPRLALTNNRAPLSATASLCFLNVFRGTCWYDRPTYYTAIHIIMSPQHCHTIELSDTARGFDTQLLSRLARVSMLFAQVTPYRSTFGTSTRKTIFTGITRLITTSPINLLLIQNISRFSKFFLLVI